ncbi:MAG: DinB family protein [Chloroflexi bacterium]|nr:DinB family protein [Chloroflexota bacterium]
MLDFTPVRNKEITLPELTAPLTTTDLRLLTNEMIDTIHNLIDGCLDEDVVFVPSDPQANDSYAIDQSEAQLAWTLGHVIVHTTASAEENAFLGAELARGVSHHGRSRFEVPWETVTTIAQCRQRLEESRRMRLASLDIWPDKPHLDNIYQRDENALKINPVTYFVLGLRHDDSHLEQIAEIVRQAKKVREEKMTTWAIEGNTQNHFGRS